MAELKTYNIVSDTADGAVDKPKRLYDEVDAVAAAAINNFQNIAISGTEIKIFGDSFKVGGEALVDAVIAAHVDSTLDEYKEIKCNAIKNKTESLYEVGFP